MSGVGFRESAKLLLAIRSAHVLFDSTSLLHARTLDQTTTASRFATRSMACSRCLPEGTCRQSQERSGSWLLSVPETGGNGQD
jgi:hypothetical protein